MTATVRMFTPASASGAARKSHCPGSFRTNRVRSPEEDLGLGVLLDRDGLELLGRLDQRYAHDVGAAQRDHLAPVAVVHGVDRVQAEPGREDAVEGGRRTTALGV